MISPALLLVLLAGSQAPHLADRVNDQAGVMRPADGEALRTLLADLERTDSTQVVLLTIPTTGGRPIEEYSIEVARANGIGQKGKNNGVLVVIAVGDRQCRIEVGTGLEGRLTDALTWHIIKTEMIPRFKSGDYSAGARAGVQAVAQAVRGEYRGTPRREEKLRGGRMWVYMILIGGIAAVLRLLGRPVIGIALLPLWPVLGWLFFSLTVSIFSFGYLLFLAACPTLLILLDRDMGLGGRGFWVTSSGWGSGGGGGSWGGSGGFSGGGGSFGGGGSSGSW